MQHWYKTETEWGNFHRQNNLYGRKTITCKMNVYPSEDFPSWSSNLKTYLIKVISYLFLMTSQSTLRQFYNYYQSVLFNSHSCIFSLLLLLLLLLMLLLTNDFSVYLWLCAEQKIWNTFFSVSLLQIAIAAEAAL